MMQSRGRLSSWLLRRSLVCTAICVFPWIAVAADPPQAEPPDAARQARFAERDQLWNEAQRLRAEGKLAEALVAGGRMLDFERDLLPGNADDLLTSINWLADTAEQAGDGKQAETFRSQALAWTTDHRGKDHWSTTDARLAMENLARRQTLGAEDRVKLAEAMREKEVAERSYGEGRFAEAVTHAEQAATLMKRVLGERHRDYGAMRNFLALAHLRMGDFTEAEPLFLEALAIFRQTLGEKHPDYAMSLNDLGGLYWSMSDFSRAEPLFKRACDINKEVLGAEDPSYARGVNNLGALYKRMGDYARAEPLYLEAVAIRKAVLGERHPDYATSLNNLAMLHEAVGDYARAEPLYLEAVKIRPEVLGAKHPDYATTLNNWAQLYVSKGEDGRAEPLFVEALGIIKETLGEEHPFYARSLSNLASLYERTGADAQAELLLVEVLRVFKAIFGDRHPDYATAMNSLAGLYADRGDFAKAEPLCVEAHAIVKETLGPHHPTYAVCLNNLALLYRLMDRPERSEPLFREGLVVARRSLETTSVVQSQRRQLAMVKSLRYQLDGYVSLSADTGRYAGPVFEQVLLWKGATLVRQRGMRLAAQDPAVKDVFVPLLQNATQLAAVSRMVPASEEERADWRAFVAKLTDEQERLEAELSRRSAPFRQATRDVKREDLLASMPRGAVLVDYLEYEKTAHPTKKEDRPTSERHLAAFVVRHAERAEDQVTMIPLGPVAPLEGAIDVWRKTYGQDEAGAAAGRQLRAAVWQPLVEHLKDADTILISTDGALGRLPLAALPGKAPGTHLIEDHRLAMIPVPQLLPSLVGDEGDRTFAYELLLLGNVDYDARTPANPADDAPQLAGIRAPADENRYPPLPGTQVEVQAIRKLFGDTGTAGGEKIALLDAAGATKAGFRRLAPQCRYLHLATHGYFAPDKFRSALSTASRDSLSPQTLDEAESNVVGYSPNLLSGLAFSGANGPPAADGDDGILTAEEIACLPLEGARLVALSACETGLGQTAGGEGLLGLQRAFQVAGARTTIASYWKVDDQATAALMALFYENLWKKKQPALDALRNAQLTILNDSSQIEAYAPRGLGDAKSLPDAGNPSLPKSGGKQRTDVRRWAAFTLSGDWR